MRERNIDTGLVKFLQDCLAVVRADLELVLYIVDPKEYLEQYVRSLKVAEPDYGLMVICVEDVRVVSPPPQAVSS